MMHVTTNVFYFLILSVFSGIFYQGFYIPKVIFFSGLILFCTIYLVVKNKILLPKNTVLYFIMAYFFASVISNLVNITPNTSYLQAFYILGLFLLYIYLLNIKVSNQRTILFTIYVTGCLQALIGLFQFFDVQTILPSHLNIDNHRVIGSVGNPEFFATLLGVCFFIGLSVFEKTKEKKLQILIVSMQVLIVVAIILAKNKGALIFISLYGIWYISKSLRLTLFLCGLGAAILLIYYPTSIYGRSLLWITSLSIIENNILTGVGINQIGNHYLQHVHDLFVNYPGLSNQFGSYTALVLDAHNIFLNHWAEMGLPGLFLSLLLVIYTLKLCKKNFSFLSIALIFLIYKSLYTVVLGSVTSALLYVTLLAFITPGELLRQLKSRFLLSATGLPVAVYLSFFTTYISLSDYYHQKGLIALISINYEKAETQIIRAIAYNPEDSYLYLALANYQFQQKDISNMVENIEKAIFYQKNIDTYKISAHMYFFSQEYSKALPLYQYLHVAYPEHLTSMGKLSLIYLKLGDHESAYNMAYKLLNTVPRVKNKSDQRNYRIARMVIERIESNPSKKGDR